MTRTRDWRRHQRVRIRRRRAHYFTVRWAHELGDPRLIDIASEHPRICSCDFCQNHYPRGKSPVELRAPDIPLFASSAEPVLLSLTYVEPHFNQSDEGEIDPLDDCYDD